jgi:two-component system, chemotaxis family, sensor kinase CheA
MTEQHREAFLEEAEELLASLEASLLELDQRPDDRELIQKTFRALHTLKGSGAMFGFDDMSRFAHEVETAFDHVREGRLAVTSELVNIALAARDQIRAMLSSGGESGPGSAEILKKLRALAPSAEGGAAKSAASAQPVRPESTSPGMSGRFHIFFRPARELFLKGTNPLLLFRELRELGELQMEAGVSGIPSLEEMQPENCYLDWDLQLETDRGVEAIRDVFIFVEDDCELVIEPVLATPQQAEQIASSAGQNLKEPWSLGSVERRRDPFSVGGEKTSIRVATDKVDGLINFVGELVVVQARLSQLASQSDTEELRLVAEEVERLTAGLRDNALSIRMLPLKATFERFRRLVHDLARDLGKEVELSTSGADTELDKTVIDQLNDPIMHLIRNSMDHGIGSPEERRDAGKPPAGTIHLSAAYSGANVLISIRDDGRGLDTGAIRAKAIQKGLITPETKLSESEIYSLVMMPGFSTAKQVTDVSGRGVGMDVVRRAVESLRGLLEITSQPGAGTTVTLRLPLTLAIIDGLLVRVAGAHFVIPLANVIECVELSSEDIRAAHGKRLANVRGELVPYIRLREYFRIPGERPEIEQIMIVDTGKGRFGFAVDEVLGDHQTVIKNLGKVYRNVQVVSGATILGNGTVALILDSHRVVQSAVEGRSQAKRADERRAPPGNSVRTEVDTEGFNSKGNRIYVA